MKNAAVIAIGIFCALPLTAKGQQPLTIIKAVYVAGDVQRDVTALVKEKVRDGQLQFDVRNQSLGGDPLFGKVKTLTVYYRNANGDFSISVDEGGRLIAPHPQAVSIAPTSQAPGSEIPPLDSQLAPDGTFYLLERVSFSTDSGIVALPPGTCVQQVGVSEGKLKVKAGEQEFEIEREKLTNDAGVATAQKTTDQQQMAVQQQAMQRKLAAQRTAELQAAESAQAEAAKEDLAKKNAANAKRVRGRIVQATNKGLLVVCESYVPVTSGMGSLGGGGGVYVPPDPNGKGRPETVEGTFWVVGHPNQNSKVDEDSIDVNAFEDGTYSYTAVTGAAKRIKQYQVVRAFQ